MQPILVEDGQENWTASKTFDYSFFKEVYSDPQVVKFFWFLGWNHVKLDKGFLTGSTCLCADV